MIKFIATINENKVVENVSVADSFFKRLRGLMFKKFLGSEDGLLIYPCKQVHTIYMRFNIDIVFMTKSGEVIFIAEDMKPGLVSKYIKDAHKVLELRGGTARQKNIKAGQVIEFKKYRSGFCGC